MLVEIIGKRNEERLITTSLKIAEKFGKEHAHVLRDIRDMECIDTFRQSNFGLSSYKSAQGKSLPMYEVTKDGFTILAMGIQEKRQ